MWYWVLKRALTSLLFFSVLSLMFFSVNHVHATSLQPLDVQDANLLKKNTGEFRLGFSFSHGLQNFFQIRDTNRHLAEIPALSLSLGLGERVEGQLYYSFLFLHENNIGERWGTGDMVFAFKVRLNPETPAFPALAVRLAAKLPNADDTNNLGTDASSIFMDFLASRKFPWFSAHLNMGVSIIESPPGSGGGQDDFINYRLGFMVPVLPQTVDFLFSAEGMTFFERKFNDRGVLRGGFQLYLSDFVLDFGGSWGYEEASEDWSTRTGLTFPFTFPSHW